MQPSIKGVIFDFNGTLFFDSDKHVLAWGKLSEDLRGIGISSEELQTHFSECQIIVPSSIFFSAAVRKKNCRPTQSRRKPIIGTSVERTM